MSEFDFMQTAQLTLATLTNLMVEWGLQAIGALVVLLIGSIVAKWVRRLIRKVLERMRVEQTLIPFLASLAYYVVLVLVIVSVLGAFGIETASLLAVIGAAGLAIGLALQGTLSNLAAGVMLLVFRPFRVGDYVEGGGTAGSVEAIGLFHTTLNTPDNVRIVVPNAQIHGGMVKNYSANPTRRNDIVLGVSYDDDIGLAIRTINQILASDTRVLKDPEPVVAVSELADSGINIVVRPWCAKEDYWVLRWDLMRALKEGIEAAGCSIPYPQRDVHLHQVG